MNTTKIKTDPAQKLKMHKLISILISFIGIALLTFMVIAEDEPGAVPLLLIAAGTGWYFITRFRIRSLHG